MQTSSSFAKSFSYEGSLLIHRQSINYADVHKKNNTCTRCVFKGLSLLSRTRESAPLLIACKVSTGDLMCQNSKSADKAI